MSDYELSTNFAAKDDLPSGASTKRILGAEWDLEFSAVATAVATKYDTADLADQATAEAGSSNTTLQTALRVQQQLAAAKITSDLANVANELQTDALDANLLLTATIPGQVVASVDVAAGVYAFEAWIPYTQPGSRGNLIIELQFSGLVTLYAAALPFPNTDAGAGGFFPDFSVSGEQLSVYLLQGTTGSTDFAYVRGSLVVTGGITFAIACAATTAGGAADITVLKGATLAVRALS